MHTSFIGRKAKVLMLSVCVSGYAGLVSAQQRLILIEHFTGENCGPCFTKNPAFLSLLHSGTNPTKLVHITWMVPIPSAGYFHKASKNLISDRLYDYYYTTFGGGCAPCMVMNGVRPNQGTSLPGDVGQFTQHEIDTEYVKPPAFNITANHKFNAAKDSVTINVTVNCVSNYSKTPKLYAAWVKNMKFPTPPGTNGEKEFEHVVRDMFPSPSGGPIAGDYANVFTAMPPPSGTTWTAGQSKTFVIKGKVKGLDTFTNVTSNDSFAVVWIQNDADRHVEQAARSKDTTQTSGIAEYGDNHNISVYPNPANDKLNIDIRLNRPDKLRIKLYDIVGKEIFATGFDEFGTVKKNVVIPMQELSAGTYFYNITNAEGKSYVNGTVVKE